jgi:hypothetical protein
MALYRRNWYYIGAILFAALSFVMGFWGSYFSPIQVILIYSFMALLVHQFEEYSCPGGFPAIFNIAVRGEKNVPERYPLNANQYLITNVFLAYPFYIAALLLPQVIWLGIAQVLFGMLQLIVHGVVINVRLKSLYNPDLAAVVFLHCPIGIYYLWYVTTNHLASAGDVVLGFLATILAAVITVLLPLRFLASQESTYPFSEAEMGGFAKQKVANIRNS